MARKAGTSSKNKDDRPAGDGHNDAPPPAAVPTGPSRLDRTRMRLRHIAGIRPIIAEIDTLRATLKAKGKLLTAARNAYKADGFLLSNLDEFFDNEKTPNRELEAKEQDRHELFEDTGQVVYVQPDLFAAMPQEARDETYWSDHGYQAGLAGKEAKPPPEMPERFMQTWLKRRMAGQEKLAWALAPDGNPERTRTDIAPGPVVLRPVDDDGNEVDDDGKPVVEPTPELV